MKIDDYQFTRAIVALFERCRPCVKYVLNDEAAQTLADISGKFALRPVEKESVKNSWFKISYAYRIVYTDINTTDNRGMPKDLLHFGLSLDSSYFRPYSTEILIEYAKLVLIPGNIVEYYENT